MRVAHVSDIHIGYNYPGPTPLSRFQDIENALTWTADKIIEEKCDLVLVAGDIYKDAKIMFDRGTDETICIGNWLRKLSDAKIDSIIISGTNSHDSLSGYKILKEMQIPRVLIYTQPQIPILPKSYNLSIACLPGLNRSSLLTNDEYKGLPPEQVHRIMTDKITQLCQGMSAQMPDDKPKILMGHLTYQNCDSGFEDLLMQNEPLLTREAVAGLDLVCLGHIHRPQCIDNKVFYSGPIERLSFNDENIIPGFYIHEIIDDGLGYLYEHRFITTSARKYVTLEWSEQDILCYSNREKFASFLKEEKQPLENAIVRLHYSCSEEVAKQLNRKQLEQALYDAGAFYVSEIKANVTRTDRARDASVSESMNPIQALDKWCINQGIEPSECAELSILAMSLMEG